MNYPPTFQQQLQHHQQQQQQRAQQQHQQLQFQQQQLQAQAQAQAQQQAVQQQQQQPHPGHPISHPHPPATPSPTGYPFQHQPTYVPNPYAQHQPVHLHQQQPFGHGTSPGSIPMHGGAMMMAGMPHEQQPPNSNNSPMHQLNFSPQVYPHSMPQTSAGQVSMPVSHPAPPPPQNMTTAAPPSLSFSVPSRASPAAGQPQAQSQPQTPTTPQPAVSAHVARERARVTVLLDINSALLQEVVHLQAAGKAGITSNQPASQSQQASPTQDASGGSPGSSAENAPDTPKSNPSGAPQAAAKPSSEYIDCMRRLQANLAYLATVADRSKKSGAAPPPPPAIMTPPPHLPSVNPLYAKLKELFPGAPAKAGPPMTPQQQQQQQQHRLRQSLGQLQPGMVEGAGSTQVNEGV